MDNSRSRYRAVSRIFERGEIISGVLGATELYCIAYYLKRTKSIQEAMSMIRHVVRSSANQDNLGVSEKCIIRLSIN